ncbi:MAG TPA: hypothetical protein DDW94_05625 [Deltaproteobacteria bacterium]|nr:MAG: hypothetical protein A2Z79_04320 [Deltaproteobacteria bacterium GWA2_55_82]OGQ64151.1 MAG: hypothetical protein A3I81_10705 [Deltaproteobacteria bacterium RIFCSPLOWO2_02_FULL_55_12]OIJ74603.1 MAG: hypothetical protein A2V21_310230 [Deltaproteobacteria bacterium GWC2_55_46]HBG46454.1 hypothetical protein [Deltaproteobacteria bacterium]HCY10666.1 hypothetical protein [Deltaproteobacteria bacterium]
MDKLFLDSHGEAVEWDGRERREKVRFPVCLAVEVNGRSSESCADFILNISRAGIFILTENPLEKGTKVKLRFSIPPEEKALSEFSIPPEEKALSEFDGVVVGANRDPGYPKGMHIKIIDSGPDELKSLEAYLEGRKHLLDTEA